MPKQVLLIDNGSRHLFQIQRLLKGADVTIVRPSQIPDLLVRSFDLIILSGGGRWSVVGRSRHYQHETELIRAAEVPIIGICLGFELIIKVHGGQLSRRTRQIKGKYSIQLAPGTWPSLVSEPIVYEAHHWVARKAPTGLIELARSRRGVEIVQVSGQPVYGLQFHPEITLPASNGRQIWNAILKDLGLVLS